MVDANTVANVIQSIGGSVGSAFVIYIAVSLRRYLKKHSNEHEFLMSQTKVDSTGIKENTAAIKRLLELQEKRTRR
jgi:hypothetical protein